MKVIFDFDEFQKTELASSKEKGYLGIALIVAAQTAKGVYVPSDPEMLIRSHWYSGIDDVITASPSVDALSWVESFIDSACVVENGMIKSVNCDWLYAQKYI